MQRPAHAIAERHGMSPQRVAGLMAAALINAGLIFGLMNGFVLKAVRNLPQDLQVSIVPTQTQPAPPAIAKPKLGPIDIQRIQSIAAARWMKARKLVSRRS